MRRGRSIFRRMKLEAESEKEAAPEKMYIVASRNGTLVLHSVTRNIRLIEELGVQFRENIHFMLLREMTLLLYTLYSE